MHNAMPFFFYLYYLLPAEVGIGSNLWAKQIYVAAFVRNIVQQKKSAKMLLRL